MNVGTSDKIKSLSKDINPMNKDGIYSESIEQNKNQTEEKLNKISDVVSVCGGGANNALEAYNATCCSETIAESWDLLTRGESFSQSTLLTYFPKTVAAIRNKNQPF